jgi:restriction system protein
MIIPAYQTIMLPLLGFVSDGKEHHVREAAEAIAKHFVLNEEERPELLPSGKQQTFNNRVSWAGTYMKAAELIEKPRRGYLRITERGLSLLVESQSRSTRRFWSVTQSLSRSATSVESW